MTEIIRAAAAFGNSDYSVDIPRGNEYYTLLYIKNAAYVTVKGNDVYVRPKAVILFSPDMPIQYRACGSDHAEESVEFYLEKTAADNLAIPFGIPVYTDGSFDADGYFVLMRTVFQSENRMKSESCRLLLGSLLTMISGEIGIFSDDPHFPALYEIRREVYVHPEEKWSIGRCAERMRISGVYFQRIYSEAFGISFGADVIRSRIDTAKKLLVVSDLPVYETAYRCGYSSEVHFSRQFRQITGVSPSVYRRNARNKP